MLTREEAVSSQKGQTMISHLLRGSAKRMKSQYLSRRELNPGLERSLDSCRQVSDDKLTY